ncbi:uncharacterized protein LOC124639183 [Helicoverpa zea]|uniref:uncharacterized protein LOC124639183 n=1 Tax=Helicoverpa zea TaxID=7113 RepID=UPI001F5A5858|nr:uncharacterized protein LOC124639183 [Helicoverpa zea]
MAENTVVQCLLFSLFFTHGVLEKITYISVEHPRITYFNPDFIYYANLTATRYGRKNPIYYVALNLHTVTPFNSSIYVDMYFYELLTNQYKRSFIEFHFDWCYLVEKDMFFGSSMRKGGLDIPCPHMGPLRMSNMTINPSVIPKGFPFTRGRIYANLSHPKTKTRVGDAYIDMRLTTIDIKDPKNMFK